MAKLSSRWLVEAEANVTKKIRESINSRIPNFRDRSRSPELIEKHIEDSKREKDETDRLHKELCDGDDDEFRLLLEMAKATGLDVLAVQHKLTPETFYGFLRAELKRRKQTKQKKNKKESATQVLLRISNECPEAKSWTAGQWSDETELPRSTVSSCKAFKSDSFKSARLIRDAEKDTVRENRTAHPKSRRR